MRTFVYASLTFVLLMSALMCFWGKSKSEHYLGFIPFFSVWDIALNQLLIFFNEIQSQAFAIMFSLLVLISAKLKNAIPSKILKLFHTTLSVGNTKQEPKLNRNRGTSNCVTNKYALSAAPSNIKKNHIINALRDLSALQNSLTQLKTPHRPNTLSADLPVTLSDIEFVHILTTNSPRQLSLTNSESNYGKILTPDKVFHTSLNLKNIQTHSNLHKSLTYFDFNLPVNINSGKEQRWLVKNSTLTEFLTKNTNIFTQSKKLLGLTNYDNNFSNKNIWLASKLSNLNNTESLSYINNLNNPLYPTTLSNSHRNSSTNTSPLKASNLLNLNFFENSRMWATKKFFFNNQMLNNLPSHAKYYSNLNLRSTGNINVEKPTLTDNIYKLLITNSTCDLNSLMWSITAKTDQLTTETNKLRGYNNLTVNNLNIDLLGNSDLNFIVNLTSNIKSSSTNPNYCSPYPTTQPLVVKNRTFV